jgi:hypothetical protein
VSVATTVVFRAVSTCLVGIGDYFIFGKRFSNDEMAMMAVVVIGAQVSVHKQQQSSKNIRSHS